MTTTQHEQQTRRPAGPTRPHHGTSTVIPLGVLEAAHAAARPARAVSEAAAVTAGVEAALAAERRCWARRLLARLGDLPVTAAGERGLLAAIAEELYAAADDIDRGLGCAIAWTPAGRG